MRSFRQEKARSRTELVEEVQILLLKYEIQNCIKSVSEQYQITWLISSTISSIFILQMYNKACKKTLKLRRLDKLEV